MSLFNKVRNANRRVRANTNKRRTLLTVDRLEDRQLLAATVYTVSNLNAAGLGSLAAAVNDANNQTGNPDGSLIQFAPGLSGTITLGSTLDLREVDGPERIVGPGASSLTISGGNAVRVFSVEPTTTAALMGMTISGGSSATAGGGIAINASNQVPVGGNLTVDHCVVSNNTSADIGGGILLDFYGHLTVTNSTIADNTGRAGGGIFNRDGTLVVVGSTIVGNTANGADGRNQGGGIYNNGPYGTTAADTMGVASISNSTITGNTAPDGGGLFENGGLAVITNSTIVGNTATFPGGYDGAGIFAYNGAGQPEASTLPSVIINNTIVVGNTDSDTGAGDDLAGGTSAGSFNLVGTDAWGTLTGDPSNQVGVTNPGLGVLASNGGPTQTIALLTGSPAIDAGSNALASQLTTDQRGNPRISGSAVDIGAYEVQVSAPQTTPTVAVVDAGGTFKGSAFAATATVNGGATLEGVGLTLDYQRLNTDGTTTDLGDVAPVNAGNYRVTAAFAGSTDYLATSTSTTFTIAQATATFAITPYSVAYDGNSHTATGTVTGVLNEDLSSCLHLDGTTHTNAGTYVDTWTFTDTSGNYAFASGTVTDTIAKASATISVTPYSVAYDGNAHTAVGSLSGLDLSGTTHTNAGTYTDTWTYSDPAGNFSDASGTVTDVITPIAASIAVTPYSITYDGAAHTATGTATGVGGVDLSQDLVLTGTTHTNAGTYTDTWTFTDPTGNYVSDSGTVTDNIAKATATVTVTPYDVVYNGAAHVATGTATGVLGEALSGLNLSGTTHTNAGTTVDTWTFTDPTGNYSDASGMVSDRIVPARATITVTPYSVTFDGAAHTASGTATGMLGEALTGLDLSGTTHTAIGTTTDLWTFSNPNYTGASGTVVDSITSPGFSFTYVTALYNDVLHRAPDAGGLSYWVSVLAAGATTDQVAQGFWNSPEHQALHTSDDFNAVVGAAKHTADDAFVTSLYQSVLGRAPDAGGLAYWDQALDSGALRRDQVVQAFWNSPESAAKNNSLTTDQFVTRLYTSILYRAPDAGGLAYWDRAIDSGMSRSSAVQGIVNSLEFIAKNA